MFLANLTHEEKNSFFNLAKALIASDGVLNEVETAMMEEYCQEMGLSPDKVIHQDVTQSLNAIQNATTAHKKQIIFELVALACVDSEYADTEHKFLEQISSSLINNTAILAPCRQLADEATEVYEKIALLVNT